MQIPHSRYNELYDPKVQNRSKNRKGRLVELRKLCKHMQVSDMGVGGLQMYVVQWQLQMK